MKKIKKVQFPIMNLDFGILITDSWIHLIGSTTRMIHDVKLITLKLCTKSINKLLGFGQLQRGLYILNA